MLVEQLMSFSPATCHADEPMERAAQIFWEQDCGCVPVVDDEAHVIGIITDRDVCMAAYTSGLRLREMPIRSAMATAVHTCHSTDSIEHAERIMRHNRVRRLPVVDDRNQIVGVLSLHDIAQEAAKERHHRNAAVTDAEVAETLSAVGARRHREGMLASF